MSRVTALLASATLLLLATGATARADGAPLGDGYRFGGTLGAGSPIGEVGVELAVPATRHAELALGAGAGLGGAQAAVMPRARWRISDHAVLDLGAGTSGGRFKPFSPCFDIIAGAECVHPSKLALWANAELGVTWTNAQADYVRLAIGAAAIVAQGAVDMPDFSDTPDMTERVWPYASVTFGRAFGR